MNEMTVVKYVGSLCAALLILMLGNTFADALYHVGSSGHGSHGDDHGELHAAYIIEVDEEEADSGDAEEVVAFADLLAAADIGKGEKVWGKCRSCHKLEDGVNGTGPHLYNIVGRQIAAVGGFGYSGALADMGGDWTTEELDAFLANPKEYAPGTKMSFAGLKKPEDRANLIAYLEGLGG